MNALQTFVQQIKEYGIFVKRVECLYLNLEYYSIDDETTAVIIYGKDGGVQHARFSRINEV